MAEGADRPRDLFNPVMTIVTVVVAVGSLYYSRAQADIARKTLEMSCNEAHAKLQAEVAGMQKRLAEGTSDRNLAELLGRLAEVQGKLAQQQKQQALTGGDEVLATLQQQISDTQQELARLKKGQDEKDREIASLRASLATATKPLPATAPLTASDLLRPRPSILESHIRGTHEALGRLHVYPDLMPDPPEKSLSARVWSILSDIGGLFSKYPGPCLYFGLAVVMALGKIFAR